MSLGALAMVVAALWVVARLSASHDRGARTGVEGTRKAAGYVSATPPSRPSEIVIRFVVDPPHAQVEVAGVVLRSKTLRQRPSKDPQRAVVSARGYVPVVRDIVPTTDQNIVLKLRRSARAPKHSATTGIKGPIETEL